MKENLKHWKSWLLLGFLVAAVLASKHPQWFAWTAHMQLR